MKKMIIMLGLLSMIITSCKKDEDVPEIPYCWDCYMKKIFPDKTKSYNFEKCGYTQTGINEYLMTANGPAYNKFDGHFTVTTTCVKKQ